MTQRDVQPTPGPWHADNTLVRYADGSLLASAVGCLTESGNRANARLMAAAPELLAVAKHVVEIMTSGDDRDWFAELADDVGILDEIIERIGSGPLEVRS